VGQALGDVSDGEGFWKRNAIYRELSAMLKIDLWTLDALWWMVNREIISHLK
jgi:hypothetical protein